MGVRAKTYSVLKTCKVYKTKIHKFMGGCWRYKPIVSLIKSLLYKDCNTKIHIFLWADVGVRKLECP